MHLLRRFVGFWYDFIVGDDWSVAGGVVVGLALTALVARSQFDSVAWLLLPLATVLVLWLSLQRAARPDR